MDKEVVAILGKLQELKEEEASNDEVYYYANLLSQELLKTRQKENEQYSSRKISVILPQYVKREELVGKEIPLQEEGTAEEKETEVEVEEEVSQNTSEKEEEKVAGVARKEKRVPVGAGLFSSESVGNDPQTSLFGDSFGGKERSENGDERKEDNHLEKELNETRKSTVDTSPSWNDRLKLEHEELGNRLRNAPVKKLSQAIGINDKFTFINELFREDQALYNRCLKTIDKCKNLNEAMYWINRELKIKLGWQDDNKTVQEFYGLVKKRFA